MSYFIYSPMADQSLLIACLLRNYFPDVDIIGVVADDEVGMGGGKRYSRIIKASEKDFVQTDGVQIPTGAVSTKNLLEKHDVNLGSITLTQAALRVFDKPWMIAKAAEAGLLVPTTWQRLDEVSFYPLFYKERYEQGGGARGIAHSSKDMPNQGQENLIFQELIQSQGTYGVGFLADKGRLLASHTHFERESLPKEGGSAVIIERFKDDRLLSYTQLLVQSIDYSGWGLAEFKYCKCRDDYVFMEINAKFWASCELAFLNEPLFLKLLFGIESREKPVQRMVFIDRALSRGLLFVINNISSIRNSKLRLYSDWLLVLSRIRQHVKKVVAKGARA